MPHTQGSCVLSETWGHGPGLMDGPQGFDLSHAMWHASGWREVAELRQKLENLRELRELVRSLGRASGKGPKRRAPEEVQSLRRDCSGLKRLGV